MDTNDNSSGAMAPGQSTRSKQDEAREKQLNEDILKIIMTIKEQSPELSKYLEEMTMDIPEDESPEIALNNLEEYYNSLKSLLKKYQAEHPTDTLSPPTTP
jgi:adenylate kinase family enzyme